eukprot:6760215-Pyramimonas_sp.AAC.1
MSRPNGRGGLSVMIMSRPHGRGGLSVIMSRPHGRGGLSIPWLKAVLDSSIPAWVQCAATLLDLYARSTAGREILRKKSYLPDLVALQCRVLSEVKRVWRGSRGGLEGA